MSTNAHQLLGEEAEVMPFDPLGCDRLTIFPQEPPPDTTRPAILRPAQSLAIRQTPRLTIFHLASVHFLSSSLQFKPSDADLWVFYPSI